MQLKELIDIVRENTQKSMWARGYTYYKKGIVDQITPHTKDGILTIDGIIGADFSNEIHYTTLEIDLKKKEVINSRCNCIDFINNENSNENFICKHNVATFLVYIDMLQRKIKKQKLEKKKKEEELSPSNQIIKISNEKLSQKRKVNIEVILNQASANIGNYYQVSFKIGSEKMYVLKSIPEFLYSKKENIPIKYGKDFEYNPITDYFSIEDEAIINFLEDFINIDQTLYKDYKSDIKLVDGKYLNILETGLKSFLKNLKNKEIQFNYNDKTYKTFIKFEDINIMFHISEHNDSLILTSNSNEIKLLNDKGDVIFFKDSIYLISDKQCYNYTPFHNIFLKNENITFKKQKTNNLLNEVLPVLKRASKNISFDESLVGEIRNNLEVKFYFDKSKNNINCFIDYIYTDDSENKNSKYIIRNFKKENEIEDIVCSYGFERSGDKLLCKLSQDELYEFFKVKIFELRELGEIYYSDKLKKIKVYKSNDIKANFNLNKQNYLEFTFNIDDVDKNEIENILQALRNKRRYYKLGNGSYIDLEDANMISFLELVDDIKDRQVLTDNNENKEDDIESNETLYNLGSASSIYLKGLIDENKLSFIKGIDQLEKVSKSFESLNTVNTDIPKTLNATLREYQVQGFKWFNTLSHLKFGGILADEMGLGKTIQTIAFLLSQKNKKSIIVTPTSLIYNWKNEFENFASDLNVLVLHGSKQERKEMIKDFDKSDVILTTYTILKNDLSELEDKEFDFCIIDEAQNIKNPYSQNSEAVKNVKSKVRFALTGTPIENNLLELWSIFDFIMPGYLYSKNKFQEKFLRNNENTLELKKQIQPFMLRRLKKEVLSQLPDKVETNFFVEMSEDQKKVYKTYVEHIKEKMKDTDFNKDKITILSYLTTLRQICLDPSIKLDDYTGESSKINILNDIVSENIQNNHKILIFSQFTSVLKNIGAKFEKENIKYLYLDGQTNPKERIELVDEFNNNKEIKIFLISLKAGGTGLNLTSADIVIHFDPWWNPAIESQATDRAHRYGQKNVVEVIKLISKGTIEENILKLQEDKKELIQKIISEDLKNESFIKMLSKEELLDLISN